MKDYKSIIKLKGEFFWNDFNYSFLLSVSLYTYDLYQMVEKLILFYASVSPFA